MHKILFLLFFTGATFFCNAQNVGIGTNSPLARLHITDSSVLFSANGPAFTSIAPPVSGAGRRLMWYAPKGAFRSGYVTGSNWDKDSTGIYSFAANYNSKARAEYSSAFGRETSAEGSSSFATGINTRAQGAYSFVTGQLCIAAGDNSLATGRENTASGTNSLAVGSYTLAGGTSSFAAGNSTEAAGQYTFAAGSNTLAKGIAAASFGSNAQALGNGSFTQGSSNVAYGINSFAGGQFTYANGTASASFGKNTIANGYASLVIGQYNDTVVTIQTSYSTTGTPLFIIGYGTTEVNRKNAFLVNSDAHTGINTSTPQTYLDINGDMSIKPYNLALGPAGGPYSNVLTGNRSFLHITGPIAPFSISGFQNGQDGKVLMVVNMSGQNMTIENLNNGSDPINRINTLSGNNIVTTGNGAVTLIYSGEENRWLVTAVRE